MILRRSLVAWWSLVLVAGCATHHGDAQHERPTPAAWVDRDGPDPNPPADLDRVPDAAPRIEPILDGGPNKPYEALGQSYVPLRDDRPLTERGLATWYGRKFHGRRTSSGERYDMYAMTAAHNTLPIPSYARVRNISNGREVVVRINDRGPFHSGRVIDLSYTAALKLGVLRGATPVEVQRITAEDIRTGAWRRPNAAVTVAAAPIAATSTAAVASSALAPDENSAPQIGSVAVSMAASEASGHVVAAPALPASEATSSHAGSTGARLEEGEAVASSKSLPLAAADGATTGLSPAHGYWLQLGAFRDSAGAEALLQQVATTVDLPSPQLSILQQQNLYRLQAGPYPSREAAHNAAERLSHAFKLSPMVVNRP